MTRINKYYNIECIGGGEKEKVERRKT